MSWIHIRIVPLRNEVNAENSRLNFSECYFQGQDQDILDLFCQLSPCNVRDIQVTIRTVALSFLP